MEEIAEQVMKKLSGERGYAIRMIRSQKLGGGCINHASLLETTAGRFFLKWNSNCPGDMFSREAEGLSELKKATGNGLVIPEVILYSEPGSTPAFILLEYLEPGHCQDSDELLGRGLARIHRYSATQSGFYHDNYCGLTPQINTWNSSWSDFFAHERIGFLVSQLRNAGMLSISESGLYDRLIGKIPELLPERSLPVLIHGDLWAENYMVTGKGPALIDPAAYYADREMEMGIMTLFGGFSNRFWAAYNEVNPLSPEWKERNKLYQLYHILNHYLLFGGGYGRQAMELAKHFL
jgi:fructosamine-3-kinase